MVLFLVQVIIISLSGVLAPGPITAVVLGAGAKSPHAGALVAIGHGIIELPLMALIYFGLGDILSSGPVRGVIFTLGGIFLLVLGVDMLRSIKNTAAVKKTDQTKPLAAGIVLSLGNAYFLIWWATVGASLISKAVTFGLIGVLLFAVIHWLCDLVWLYLLSAVSYKGGAVLGIRFQQTVFAVCGCFLLFFGGMFLRDAVNLWIG